MQSHSIAINVDVSQKEYFEEEIEPVEVFTGEDFSWYLPALKEGLSAENESIEVNLGAAADFLKFDKLSL